MRSRQPPTAGSKSGRQLVRGKTGDFSLSTKILCFGSGEKFYCINWRLLLDCAQFFLSHTHATALVEHLRA